MEAGVKSKILNRAFYFKVHEDGKREKSRRMAAVDQRDWLKPSLEEGSTVDG